MTKQEARTLFKEKRKALTRPSIDEMSLGIANKTLEISSIWSYSTYHLFLSIEAQKEVNTEYLLHILHGKDKNVVVSKSNFEDLSMQHFLLTEQSSLKKNKWGIPEPNNGIQVQEKQLDVVFVPLLGVDKKGQRVGYGKGFYDRFLAVCQPGVIKVGLGFFSPLQEELKDVNANDIPLNVLITHERIFHFS